MDRFNPNSLLAPFLRKLADDIDKQEMSEKDMQRIGEFYISWFFKKGRHGQPATDKDFMKFITMGWYVYQQISKNEVNPK